MEEKQKFIPLCFQKEIQNLSNYSKEGSKYENIMYREIPTNLSAKDNFSIFKNLEKSLGKASDSLESRKKINLKDATKIFKISNNCDTYNIKISLKLFKFLNYDFTFKLVRFYSYSKIKNYFFFLFKLLDEKDESKSLCKGGIIIPKMDKKIIIFVKKPKINKISYTKNNFESYLDLFVDNYKIISEAVGDFFSQEDLDEFSSVEIIDCEKEINELKRDLKDKIDLNEIEENKQTPKISNKSKNSNTSISSEEEIYEDSKSEKKSEKDNETIIQNESDSEFEETEEEYDNSEIINIDEEINVELIPNKVITFNSNSESSEHFINIKPVMTYPNQETVTDSIKKFLIDESDPDYSKIKKLTQNDLKELNLLDQFIELKNELIKMNKNIFSENELIRYIYGWRGRVQNIKENLIELEIWRKNFKPELISLKEFENDKNFNFADLLSIPCQDIFGRPIIQIKAKNLTQKKIFIETFVKFLVYTLESAIKLMPENIDKLMIVIDIKDAGLENFSLQHLNKIREVTSKFYVERLSNIVIINKGFFFSMMFSFVSKFLDERILRKLIVLDNSKKNWFIRILGENSGKIPLS